MKTKYSLNNLKLHFFYSGSYNLDKKSSDIYLLNAYVNLNEIVFTSLSMHFWGGYIGRAISEPKYQIYMNEKRACHKCT